MFNNVKAIELNTHKWALIRKALEEYKTRLESQLIKENVGDREWDEVYDLEELVKSIDLYVIPPEKNT